ncbi:MAG: aconitase X, partial [Candidatus Promineifilaceae bacterium]
MTAPTLTPDQAATLAGRRGPARQLAMRLLLDLAAAAGAQALVPIQSAHLSGVSPLTGGQGLLRLLRRLAADPGAQVAVPTTLNAAGCDFAQFERMRIAQPDFLARSREIVALYTQLGVRPILSCVPYEWEGVRLEGPAAWAESNAICFGNSYGDLRTNRESGLSALAAALTGFAPGYGLLAAEARRPNLEVVVACPLAEPTDFSILGDWVGKQLRPGWRLPFGPIPLFHGLPAGLSHAARKALAAGVANYGAPLLYLEPPAGLPADHPFQARLTFSAADLAGRYAALAPRRPLSLVVLGCPQASLGELR